MGPIRAMKYGQCLSAGSVPVAAAALVRCRKPSGVRISAYTAELSVLFPDLSRQLKNIAGINPGR
ncbi:hypothetical protein [Collimonas humicola]|uniref:hypothetical protein n=1 Tax=Collimonas humicola TaxID=2825886 RepID=UPI001B8AAA22|nr:hypothetical protein [Collimonas humicola]